MEDLFAHAEILSNWPGEQPAEPAVAAGTEEAADVVAATPTQAAEPSETDEAEETDAAPPEEAEETDAEEPARATSRLTQRFRDLTQRAKAAEARAAQATEAFLALQQQMAERPAETDAEHFQQTVALEVSRQLAEAQRSQAAQDARAVITAKYPDFESVIQASQVPASAVVGTAIQQSPARMELLYHFAKHSDELAVLNAADPLQVVAALRTLSTRLQETPAPVAGQPAAPRTTQAPAPITPVRGRAPIVPPNIDTMSLSEYAAYMDAEARKRPRNGWG